MAWTIEYAASVRKSVEKLDSQTRQRMRMFLDQKVANLDDPRGQGRALTGPLAGLWRYRVGDYRIICEIQDRKLVGGHIGSPTRRLQITDMGWNSN